MERRADARSSQWFRAPDETVLPCDAATMAALIAIAPSQVVEEWRGLHPTLVTPEGGDMPPEGSNNKTAPACRRLEVVAFMTSGFVDVATTLCAALNTFGMMTEVVFPLRVGPRINALR